MDQACSKTFNLTVWYYTNSAFRTWAVYDVVVDTGLCVPSNSEAECRGIYDVAVCSVALYRILMLIANSGVHPGNFFSRHFAIWLSWRIHANKIFRRFTYFTQTKNMRKYRPFCTAYACIACSPSPDENNTINYVQHSLGATAEHDIWHSAEQTCLLRIAIRRKKEDFQVSMENCWYFP